MTAELTVHFRFPCTLPIFFFLQLSRLVPRSFSMFQHLLTQKYVGHITIVPDVGLRDLLGFFHNPSEAMIQRAIAIGEASTWKCMGGRAVVLFGCASCFLECIGKMVVLAAVWGVRLVCLCTLAFATSWASSTTPPRP